MTKSAFRMYLTVRNLKARAKKQPEPIADLLLGAANTMLAAQRLSEEMKAARMLDLDTMDFGEFKALVLRKKLSIALPISELKELILETEFPDLF